MTTFDRHSTAEAVSEGLDLSGTTWLVTGVSSGLGLETARVLGLRGAHVVGLARTLDKAARALESAGTEGTPVGCELSSLRDVRAAVDTVAGLGVTFDGFIANAGIMALPELSQVAGIERQLFVNHVGHFALITPLLGTLSARGRVVMLSSHAHFMARDSGLELDNVDGARDYHPWRMYARSKLANILFARRLARDFAGAGQQRTANAVHPGVIQTNLARHVPDPEALFAKMKDREKTVPQGASTQVWAAVHPSLDGVSGRYFSDCAEVEPIAHAVDDALADALWAWTESVVSAG